MEDTAAEAHGAGGTREIRAIYDDRVVRVYQAYNPEIADAAVAAQRFVSPWSPNRMTWIKPVSYTHLTLPTIYSV